MGQPRRDVPGGVRRKTGVAAPARAGSARIFTGCFHGGQGLGRLPGDVKRQIDLDRIRGIERTYGGLDPLDAYYRKRAIHYQTSGPLIPSTRSVLEQALRGAGRALDVGCRDGSTLLDCSSLFDSAVGLDASGFALQRALSDASRRGVTNVEFVQGRAIRLPFPDSSFDVVFSERGPLAHADSTLAEAHRVLRPGGRIFVETGSAGGATLLSGLEVERQRFERVGFALEVLAGRVEEERYQDIYAWFEMQCSTWRYFERLPPFPYTEETLQSVADRSGGPDHPVVERHHTFWIGGLRNGASPDAGVGTAFSLATRRLRLRDFEESDLEAVQRYASDPLATRYLGWGPNGTDETRAFLVRCLKNRYVQPRGAYELAITLPDGELIGGCGLDVGQPPARHGFLGYILHPEYWGHGYATEAARALVDMGFQDLGLTRIAATCDVDNGPSAHVLEKVGMQLEGRLRGHALRGGVPADSYTYAILLDDWRRCRATMER